MAQIASDLENNRTKEKFPLVGNNRPSSVYFICISRFGSHFRSHDSHVTGEHMGELGAIFCCCFSARASSSSTYKYKYKDTSTVYLK